MPRGKHLRVSYRPPINTLLRVAVAISGTIALILLAIYGGMVSNPHVGG